MYGFSSVAKSFLSDVSVCDMLLCTKCYCSSSNEARISMLGSRVESVVCSEMCISSLATPVNFILTSASFMFLFLLYAMIGGLGIDF